MFDFIEKRTTYFPKKVTEKQAGDTGMALVLVCLITVSFGFFDKLLSVAIGLLVVNMIAPGLYKPLVKVWLGFSNVIGTIMSKILLTFVFFLIVTPIALVRKAFRADPLQVGIWKQDTSSVFKSRDHEFGAHEMERPF